MVDDLDVIGRLVLAVFDAELDILVLLILIDLSSQLHQKCFLAQGLKLLVVIIRDTLKQVFIVVAEGRIQGPPPQRKLQIALKLNACDLFFTY